MRTLLLFLVLLTACAKPATSTMLRSVPTPQTPFRIALPDTWELLQEEDLVDREPYVRAFHSDHYNADLLVSLEPLEVGYVPQKDELIRSDHGHLYAKEVIVQNCWYRRPCLAVVLLQAEPGPFGRARQDIEDIETKISF